MTNADRAIKKLGKLLEDLEYLPITCDQTRALQRMAKKITNDLVYGHSVQCVSLELSKL